MKSLASVLLVAIGMICSASNNVAAQDRTLNGFTFDTLYNSDSGFIENRFGVKQIAMTSVPVNNDSNAFYLGEQASIDIKLHDYVGVSGKFLGSFQVGGNSSNDSFKFFTSGNVRVDGSVNLKVFRSEKNGSEAVFHLKTTYQHSNGMLGDMSGLSFNLDKSYYEKLIIRRTFDTDDVFAHIKDDLQKSLKNSLSQSTSTSEITYIGGGASVSVMKTLHRNVAIQTSFGLLVGENSIRIDDVSLLPSIKLQATMGITGCVALYPWIPATVRLEYEYEITGDNKNNLVLGSFTYGKKESPVNVIMSVGKYFIGHQSTPVGSIAFDYYF